MTTKQELKDLFGSKKELKSANFAKLIDAFAIFLQTEVGLELDQDLFLASSDEGGLNDFDSTTRIELESYQKAQRTNPKGEAAHYGELIRLKAMHQQAKAAIAFQQGYVDGILKTVAWLVAHGEANDSTPENPSWHNHFSLEVPDLDGMLQTVAEMPFAPANVPNAYGIDLDDMQFRTTNKLVAGNQGLWVEGAPGTDRTIKYGSGKYAKKEDRRWASGVDGTEETGGQAGSDYRISRHKDDGTFIDSPFFIKRSNGSIGLGTTAPTRPLDINGNTIRLRQSNTPSGPSATGEAGCIRWDKDNLYLHNGVEWKQIPLENMASA